MKLSIIQNKIYEIRGYRVMLDFDLAGIYKVETRALNQAVKRNIMRFPHDFMFQLTTEEWKNMSSQIVMTSRAKRPLSYLPFAFTEHGVTMLSSVLKSEKAIDTNIKIVRAFILLRQYALGYAELNQKLEDFMISTNMQFSEVYQALTELAEQKKELDKPRKRIGYIQE
ncbi:MAG: ORF6N domain-containing protein [Marinilabiliaceae bacterium]|nr:ORF6N domain-containing protein [Marinilabiliaceae bacterium]